LGRPKGSQSSRVTCNCGACPTCYKRRYARRVASGEHVPKSIVPRKDPAERARKTYEAVTALKPNGWGSEAAVSRGGIMSDVARKQQDFFARRRAAWAQRIAEVMAP